MSDANAKSAVRVWQLSDSHCYPNDGMRLEWSEADIYPNQSLRAVLTHLQTQAAEYSALFFTGDLAQEETAATYQRINALVADFPLPIYAVAGNHDVPALMQANLTAPVVLQDYVNWGVWHAILLDTSAPNKPDGHLSAAQLLRLEALLTDIPAQHFVVIFMHHHPVLINSAWMDVMGLQQREQFWGVIAQFPQVKAVFNGHIHQAFSGEHVFPTGRKVAVFGTPATSIQLKPVNPVFQFDHTRPAWREISLNPDGSITTQVEYLTPRV